MRFYEDFNNIYLILSPRLIFKLCIFWPNLVLLDLIPSAGTCQKKKKKIFLLLFNPHLRGLKKHHQYTAKFKDEYDIITHLCAV